MNFPLRNLTVLRGLYSDRVFSAFCDAAEDGEAFSDFLWKLFCGNAETDFTEYVRRLIVRDVNAFSVTCAQGGEPSAYLRAALERDLKAVAGGILSFDDRGAFSKGDGDFLRAVCARPSETAERLAAFYRCNGYGDFISTRAFAYRGGKLIPLRGAKEIHLSDLKNYDGEKKTIGNNIECLLRGLPYAHMLLYGDRGTGKSSTVQAMLSRYFADGLRLVELKNDELPSLGDLLSLLSSYPMKFVVLLDDLTLSEDDGALPSLKTCLEGGAGNGCGNAMVIATSNRRHIVKESFSDRDDQIHPADRTAELLSLSDRFGIAVLFSATDRASYLDIVMQLARDRGLKTSESELAALAERWALIKGGRSPRRAKQFTDYIYACEAMGIGAEF